MINSLLTLLVTDGLWLMVAAGWVLLLMIGLEADRPMSGGLPGHTVAHDDHNVHQEGTLGKLGEYGAWALFGLATLSLPFILWWIFGVAARG